MYQEITGWVAGPKFGVEVDGGSLSAINEYKPDFLVVPVDRMDDVPGMFENLIISVTTSEWQIHKSSLLLAKGKILYLELKISILDELVLGTIHEISEDFKILLETLGNN